MNKKIILVMFMVVAFTVAARPIVIKNGTEKKIRSWPVICKNNRFCR